MRFTILCRTILLLLGSSLFVACQTAANTEEGTPTLAPAEAAPLAAVPTATVVEVIVKTIEVTVTEPEPEPGHLVICLSQEPLSLYPYAEDRETAVPIYHAIYENNITQRRYGYQAQGLEKLPSLADGDARWQKITVGTGHQVVDAAGRVVELEIGVEIINADGELVAFAGEPLTMTQMVVDFTLKPRVWSDGQAVTAVDSVYSFKLAAAPATPGDRHLLERTAGYEATGRLALRWTGRPGFYDDTYFLNFWPPLPHHAWEGLSAVELLTAEAANRTPIGDGPFMVESWQPGDRLHLQRNPFYYRAAEGLPYLDQVTFRFLAQTDQLLAELLSGDCDIVTQDSPLLTQASLLFEAESNGLLSLYFQTGTIYEHIGFGINSYGGYGDNIGRPDWFEDERVRQAITMCTDRQQMVDQLLFGRVAPLPAYVPDDHPLIPDALARWPHSPAEANALLDELGYELGRDGLRRYPGGPNGEFVGEPFRLRLATTQGNELRRRVTQLFQENMLDCGIEVERHTLPAAELFAAGPSGPIFGRRFDLVAFGWPLDLNLACNLFLSDNIPGPADEINPDHYREGATFAGWEGNNHTGWVSEAFDTACYQAMTALPGTAVYDSVHREAITIFAQELPLIPLFPRLKVAAARPEVINFYLDATQPSELYNLYEIDLQP
jgi:peptide/nickel transport system substrate-binding protein